MYITVFIQAFVLLLAFACYWVLKPNVKKPPAFPGALPIIGHAHLLVGDTAHLWQFVKCMQQHNLDNGGVTYIKIGTKTYYALSDPEDCTKVASVCFEKSFFYRNIVSSWVGQGLVTASVPTWKIHRKMLNPVFKQQVLESFLGIINSHGKILVENMAAEVGKTPFDPVPYLDKAILEASFRIAFGAARNDKEIKMDSYIQAFKEVTNILIQRFQHVWMHSRFIYSFSNLKKKQDKAIKTTCDVSFEIIKKKKSDSEITPKISPNSKTDNNKVKGLLDVILDVTKGGLTVEEIREELDTMIFAGYDTVATTLIYVLVVLGSYPDIQERTFLELQEVLKVKDNDIDKEDLQKLVYLEAVIKETLRIFPIAPIIIRELDKDVQLENYTLQAGSECIMLIYATCRHPVWGEDRHEFKPERWLDPSKLPENPNSFATFGVGRRSCIGKAYALMSLKTILSHIVRHYKIKGDYTKLDMKMEILTKPIAGHHITLEHRIW
ncbi:cytochrome P450 4V2-like [Ostrinia furnacalis]|uniref:cytochrome P450 4V2-like n=1 Tax=Ostrinia furnacalis TaxID=93504 RepID=UPI00103B4B60|nr:cytochrome P450 4V2-like [Ostrinia furnacalis]